MIRHFEKIQFVQWHMNFNEILKKILNQIVDHLNETHEIKKKLIRFFIPLFGSFCCSLAIHDKWS